MKRGFRIVVLVLALLLTDVSAASGDSLPEAAFVSGFIGHAQSYAIDCEVRSAVDWASFWGVRIDETEFLQALPRTDNPDRGFVGDPNDVWGRIPPYGYGVHADPIAKTLRDYGLQARAVHDYSWDDLRKEIDDGHPAIVWIIGAMWEGTPVEYVASDGSTTRVAAYEHTMTLVGYTARTVQVVDSATGYLDTYWLDDFLTSWAVLGNMAVVGPHEADPIEELPSRQTLGNAIQGASQDLSQDTQPNISQAVVHEADRSVVQGLPLNSNQEAIQSSDPGLDQIMLPDALGGTYTVQRGDYVMKLARRLGVSWLELAQLNSLYPPYIIYPGQVLQLPMASLPEAATEAVASPTFMPGDEFREYLPVAQRHTTLLRMYPASSAEPGQDAPQSDSHAYSLVTNQHGIWLEVSLLARLNSLRPSHVLFPGWMLGLQ